ncbi:MAG: isoprenylcysteine carboxylmethyltransferase family protein [Candidatus Acidiferrales bacterium]
MAATPKLALASLVSTLLFLTIAVAGWGGVRPFFANPARIAFVVILLVLTVASWFSSGNISSGDREDRSNRWVLAVFTILSILSMYFSAYTDRKNIWVIDGDAARWTGVALLSIGGVIRLWPVFVLGNRFSGLVAIQPGHTLVTTGIYGVVRNPSYVGLLLSSFAGNLAFRSVVGMALSALMIPALIARIHSEERLLGSQFGAEYEAYRRRTWRLIPGLY